MIAALLLDTHIALWLDSGSDRLKKSTRDRIDRCWLDGGTVYLSAVSAWEIALLVDMNRIALDCPPADWVERFVGRQGIEATPLGHRAAARAYSFENLAIRDPADRLLIAAAIELGCSLVTYDANITEFARSHGRKYSFATAA